MNYRPENPLIVQSDKTVFLEVANPRFESARDALARFAELEKSPEHVHTYRISPLSLWNAAAAGVSALEVIQTLEEFGKFPLPENLRRDISDYIDRYGRLKLTRQEGRLYLSSSDRHLITEIWHQRNVRPYLLGLVDAYTVEVDPPARGKVKQALIKIGFPVEDLAGYMAGAPLEVGLRDMTRSGRPFTLRTYQKQAVDAFHAGGGVHGGSGVIALPCGAGKTVVGIAAIARLGCQTLILTTSTVAVRQWIEEVHDKSTLSRADIGEYTGEAKEIRPVTVSTYQILTHRESREEEFRHFALFGSRDWGLIVYDEVHLLPAPVFRVTAEIQARRRLGLTATLVREDGREDDVFTLIGPKRFDVPWRELERQGWIAQAECSEIRVELPGDQRLEYAVADERAKFRLASENPEKIRLVRQLAELHRTDQVLVIGQYLDQLKAMAEDLGAPLITGQTPTRDREDLYRSFREGSVKLLVVSKVANFSVDLPDANVAVQVSGTFGSRQEEAQRLGRILRPKTDCGSAKFYTLVTRDTKEQDFAAKRQLFLTEQGYRYTIMRAEDIGG